MTPPRDRLFSPARLGPVALRNRIWKAATFEGMCPGGVPSDALIEHHRGIAAGGAGLTTVAYASVSADLERVAGDFARGATLAVDCGFDAVELHLGHGYLLSQFLSPFTNRRKDDYGGSLENRARFPVEVVRRVRDAVGSRAAVATKLNLEDGFAGGLQIDESVEVARRLEAEGVDAIQMSGGFVSKAPLYMLRGEVPLRAMVGVQKSLVQKIGLSLFGRLFVKEYPYTEAFFADHARTLRAAVRAPLCLLGGLKSIETLEQAMTDGFDFVAMARALIHDPQLPSRLRSGERTRSGCVPCNRCIAEMDRGGVRCVKPDAEDDLGGATRGA